MNRWGRLVIILFLVFLVGYFLINILFASVREDGQLIVAVIDSGVDYTHEELKGRVIKGKDFVDGDNDPMDENGHGTHVATQITEKTKEAKILAIRTLDKEGKGEGDALSGVLYALFKGADIVNMSYSETYHPFMPFLIWYGEKRGVLFVAATGNEGKKDIDYPAKYKGVIPIGAIDATRRELYEEGNLNEQVQFVAPGVRVEGADVANKYALRTGTSMATGYASGVLAYLLEQAPTLTKSELLAYLAKHAPYTKDGRYQQIEFDRILALQNPKKIYAKIKETPAVTKEEIVAIPIEVINVEKIEGYDFKNEQLFTTEQWGDALQVPLPKEGFQQVTLRFYQEEEQTEETFFIIKDTKKPDISYLYATKEFLSFIVTDHTLKNITLNGENVNKYIRHKRTKEFTYHFVKPIEEAYPLTLEIEDQTGHKTTKILYEEHEK